MATTRAQYEKQMEIAQAHRDRRELADALEALLSPSVSTAIVENARALLRRVRGETKETRG